MVELTLNPDNHYMAKLSLEEREKLDKIQENLNPTQIEQILKDSLALKEFQKKQEGLSIECLPKIEIKDVPKKNKLYPLNIEDIKGNKVYHHSVFTNEIIYVDLLFDLPKLTLDELILLSLFASLITDIGAANRNYVENLEYIQAYTGGISAYVALNVQADNFDNFIPSIGIRGQALYRNTDKLFSLIKDIITEPDFSDKTRIKEILLQQYTYLENSIVQGSMRYASMLSSSSFTKPSFISSKLNGIDYLYRLRVLIKDLDKNLPSLIESLKNLKDKVFLTNKEDLVISSCDNGYKNLKTNNFYGIFDLDLKKAKLFESGFDIEKIGSSANIISSPVAFTASSYKTIGFLHEDSPFLLLASNLFRNKTLHKKIREEGGAYGSGAKYSPSSGLITFNGFRDPHITSTLDAFKLSIQEIAKGNFDVSDIDEAKLGAIQNTDVPISPGSRAFTAYSWIKANKTDERRQKFRDKVLNATKEDIVNSVKTHLLNQMDKNVTISFCSKELLDKEKADLEVINNR